MRTSHANGTGATRCRQRAGRTQGAPTAPPRCVSAAHFPPVAPHEAARIALPGGGRGRGEMPESSFSSRRRLPTPAARDLSTVRWFYLARAAGRRQLVSPPDLVIVANQAAGLGLCKEDVGTNPLGSNATKPAVAEITCGAVSKRTSSRASEPESAKSAPTITARIPRAPRRRQGTQGNVA